MFPGELMLIGDLPPQAAVIVCPPGSLCFLIIIMVLTGTSPQLRGAHERTVFPQVSNYPS